MKSWLWLYRSCIVILLASLVSVYLSIRYSNKKMSLYPRNYQTNRDVQYIYRVEYLYLPRFPSDSDAGLFSAYKNHQENRRYIEFYVPFRFEIKEQNSWTFSSNNSKNYSDACYTTRTMMKEILQKHGHLFEKNNLGFYGLRNSADNRSVLREGDDFALETLGSLIIFAAAEDFYTEIGFSEEILSALLRPNVDILNEHYQKSEWAKSTIRNYQENLYGFGSCFALKDEKLRIEKDSYYGIREGEIIRLLDDLTPRNEKDPYFWLLRGKNLILADKTLNLGACTPRLLNEKFTASQPFSKNDWIQHGIELEYYNYWQIDNMKNSIRSLSRQKAFEFYKKLTGYEKYPYGGAVRGVRVYFKPNHRFTRDNGQKLALVFNSPSNEYTSENIKEFLRSN